MITQEDKQPFGGRSALATELTEVAPVPKVNADELPSKGCVTSDFLPTPTACRTATGRGGAEEAKDDEPPPEPEEESDQKEALEAIAGLNDTILGKRS